MDRTDLIARITLPRAGSANRFPADIRRGELVAVHADAPITLLREIAGRAEVSHGAQAAAVSADGQRPLRIAYTDGTPTGGPLQTPGHYLHRQAPAQADTILKALRLTDCAVRHVTELTMMERFRFELGKAFAAGAELVLLDLAEEDLSGDATLADDIWMLTMQLSQTVMIATDDPVMLAKADRILLMEGGFCTAFDTPASLRAHPATEAASYSGKPLCSLRATVTARGPKNRVGLDLGGLTVPSYAWEEIPPLGAEVILLIAPEEINCSEKLHRGFHLTAEVTADGLLLPDGQILAGLGKQEDLGKTVFVWWNTEHTGVCAPANAAQEEETEC